MEKIPPTKQWKKRAIPVPADLTEFYYLKPSLKTSNASFPLTTRDPNSAQRGCSSPVLCPLNLVQAGACVRVRQISAAPDVSRRLREIGFTEEQQVRLISSSSHVICMVCNARLAISSELAKTIMVEPIGAAPARPS